MWQALCLGVTSSLLLQVPFGGITLISPAKEKTVGGVAPPGGAYPVVGAQNLPLLSKDGVLAKSVIVAGAVVCPEETGAFLSSISLGSRGLYRQCAYCRQG